jgi:hypothetical protein
MVLTIEKQDLNVGLRQAKRGIKSGKTSPDDHYSGHCGSSARRMGMGKLDLSFVFHANSMFGVGEVTEVITAR